MRRRGTGPGIRVCVKVPNALGSGKQPECLLRHFVKTEILPVKKWEIVRIQNRCVQNRINGERFSSKSLRLTLTIIN